MLSEIPLINDKILVAYSGNKVNDWSSSTLQHHNWYKAVIIYIEIHNITVTITELSCLKHQRRAV